MQKVALLFTFIIFLTSSASASVLDNRRTRQLKNDLETARLAVRNAVNLVEDNDESRKRINALRDNERKLSGYFNDSVFRWRKDLWLISLDILKKQYDVYNDRLYMKMPIDTMAMVLKGQQLLGKMLSFDSLEVGKSYRKKHSELMASIAWHTRNGKRHGIVLTFILTAEDNRCSLTSSLIAQMMILLLSWL